MSLVNEAILHATVTVVPSMHGWPAAIWDESGSGIEDETSVFIEGE